jgi:DNA-binding NarL/FixJ family response regulator
MSLWQRLLHTFGFHRTTDKLSFQLNLELLQSLQGLAENEQRSQDEVAADLLSIALAQRDAANFYLERWRDLSPREQQVAALVCLGYTNRQIANRLVISIETVKSHVRSVLNKFNLHSKIELRQTLSDWDFSDWR